MSRRKRALAPGQVQASQRAVIRFWPRTGARGGGDWTIESASGDPSYTDPRLRGARTFGACVERVRALGFGAYTFEGATVRLRSRYVAGDRPPPPRS